MPFHWEITWAVRVTVTGFFVFLNLFVEKWQQVERWPYWMLSQSLAWIRPSDTRERGWVMARDAPWPGTTELSRARGRPYGKNLRKVGGGDPGTVIHRDVHHKSSAGSDSPPSPLRPSRRRPVSRGPTRWRCVAGDRRRSARPSFAFMRPKCH